ncbi:MAG: zinc metallopeptidase, partial [Clostridia bacterium]|nr:zinc metallopeptidase [Clostridia bacterium]
AARKTLSAAAMTYVAALASSLASLLRLLLIFNNRRR